MSAGEIAAIVWFLLLEIAVLEHAVSGARIFDDYPRAAPRTGEQG